MTRVHVLHGDVPREVCLLPSVTRRHPDLDTLSSGAFGCIGVKHMCDVAGRSVREPVFSGISHVTKCHNIVVVLATTTHNRPLYHNMQKTVTVQHAPGTPTPPAA